MDHIEKDIAKVEARTDNMATCIHAMKKNEAIIQRRLEDGESSFNKLTSQIEKLFDLINEVKAEIQEMKLEAKNNDSVSVSVLTKQAILFIIGAGVGSLFQLWG